MLFNLHNSTRHFSEKREGLGKREPQSEALVHYLAPANRKRRLPLREPLSPQVPSAPVGPQRTVTQARRTQPHHTTFKRARSYFYMGPSGLQQLLLISEQNACQNKEIIDTVLAGRWKEQEVLLKWVAQKIDLSTTTYVPKRLWIPPLRSRPQHQRDCAQAQFSWDVFLLCCHLRVLNHQILTTLCQQQSKRLCFLFKLLNISPTSHDSSSFLFSTSRAYPQSPKPRLDGTTGCFGTSSVDSFKCHIVLIIKECLQLL